MAAAEAPAAAASPPKRRQSWGPPEAPLHPAEVAHVVDGLFEQCALFLPTLVSACFWQHGLCIDADRRTVILPDFTPMTHASGCEEGAAAGVSAGLARVQIVLSAPQCGGPA